MANSLQRALDACRAIQRKYERQLIGDGSGSLSATAKEWPLIQAKRQAVAECIKEMGKAVGQPEDDYDGAQMKVIGKARAREDVERFNSLRGQMKIGRNNAAGSKGE